MSVAMCSSTTACIAEVSVQHVSVSVHPGDPSCVKRESTTQPRVAASFVVTAKLYRGFYIKVLWPILRPRRQKKNSSWLVDWCKWE